MSYPEPIQQLIDLFTKFPGIGPRQAARLAFFVCKSENSFAEDLARAVMQAKEKIISCQNCFRTMEKNGIRQMADSICSICANPHRNKNTVTVIEKEADLINLEKSGSYSGQYHVLGGVISPLDSNSPKRLRLKNLFDRVELFLKETGEGEVIFATNPTTEGDTTALYIERILSPLKNKYPGLIVSRLARGLSLGSELEYADESTIRNALENRIKRV